MSSGAPYFLFLLVQTFLPFRLARRIDSLNGISIISLIEHTPCCRSPIQTRLTTESSIIPQTTLYSHPLTYSQFSVKTIATILLHCSSSELVSLGVSGFPSYLRAQERHKSFPPLSYIAPFFLQLKFSHFLS